MTDHRYWVGPVGGLRPLPDRLVDLAVASTPLGGVFSSLNYTVTVDGGAKKSWAWAWTDLLEAETVYVKALRERLVRGPLRLVNPREPNRYPVQVAAGGSQRKSPTGFATPTGTLRFRWLDDIGTDPATLPAAALNLPGAIAWTLPAGGGELAPSWRDTLGRWRLPLLPGEQVELSAWACADATVPARIRWSEDRGGSSPVVRSGTPTTLNAARWRRVSALVTPGAGARALAPSLVVDDTAPAATVHTTAWMASVPGSLDLPPEVTTLCGDPSDDVPDWRPGGGAPHVQVGGDGAAAHRRPGMESIALTLVEA